MKKLLISALFLLPVITLSIDVKERQEKLSELEEICKKYGKKPKAYFEVSHPIKIEKISERILKDEKEAEETPIRRMQVISNDNIDTYCE